jgi:hypothetical protein
MLILPTHLRLGLPSGLLSSGFPTNILYAFLFPPIRAHLILLDLIILIILGEGARGSVVGWGTMLQTGRSPVQVPVKVDFFNPCIRTMTLGSTQPLTEMSTRNLPGVKKRPARSQRRKISQARNQCENR